MKLPKNAKLVFKGNVFDTYQWEQKLYDGSTDTFEMLKRPNTVDVIATSDKQVFIAKQEQPIKGKFFSLLGGRQDEGESSLETAKRELLEEAGLESNDWELWQVFEPYTKIEWEVFIYIAKNCQKVSAQNTDAGEKIEVLELSFEQFVDKVTEPGFGSRETVEDFLRMKLEPKKLEEFRKKIF
ncbi:MAG: hypothetical protein COX81_00845 [Candidatus Magasanikbacteria bacterium CG_4_10_14_0_2_um_filter_37_12]|uniref:Nudix hydrolase domain-containing protein n=1 Tax=Candidatus Magasanikbacteria bacterium CG_4_10_14_0_2_um_filter_37_12 TaxID=1974637 RepID=A0A2M7V9E1_9BACT|nr:MAG: hypothetical protein COX81_00845 [Candidatus Magasanikbacteria bacterium CG_4_10_14_0_2_um_filter_37_12]